MRRDFVTLLGGRLRRSNRPRCRPLAVRPRHRSMANGSPHSSSGCANSVGSGPSLTSSGRRLRKWSP